MITKLQEFIEKAKEALAEKEEDKAQQLRKEALKMSKELGLPLYFTAGSERKDNQTKSNVESKKVKGKE